MGKIGETCTVKPKLETSKGLRDRYQSMWRHTDHNEAVRDCVGS